VLDHPETKNMILLSAYTFHTHHLYLLMDPDSVSAGGHEAVPEHSVKLFAFCTTLHGVTTHVVTAVHTGTSTNNQHQVVLQMKKTCGEKVEKQSNQTTSDMHLHIPHQHVDNTRGARMTRPNSVRETQQNRTIINKKCATCTAYHLCCRLGIE
jgi:hypothetical protein